MEAEFLFEKFGYGSLKEEIDTLVSVDADEKTATIRWQGKTGVYVVSPRTSEKELLRLSDLFSKFVKVPSFDFTEYFIVNFKRQSGDDMFQLMRQYIENDVREKEWERQHESHKYMLGEVQRSTQQVLDDEVNQLANDVSMKITEVVDRMMSIGGWAEESRKEVRKMVVDKLVELLVLRRDVF